jgi:hypothetical protein
MTEMHPDSIFRPETIIIVNDKMQADYRYKLKAPVGCRFPDGFNPCFTPKQMLEMGVFEGKYSNDCIGVFLSDWF